MPMTIEDVKKNVAYKQLPLVTLDERWHHLFPEKDKTPEIKRLEEKLNNLLKRQGQITNDLKAVSKIKNDLMKEIVDNVENDKLSEAKREKLMLRNQRLILEAKEKIESLEDEQLAIPGMIRDANIELVIEGVATCYTRIHKNYDDIQLLGKWINEMRIELKKKILIKQDKETKNTEIYSYMHDLLGPEMMEVFDSRVKKNTSGEGNNEQKDKNLKENRNQE